MHGYGDNGVCDFVCVCVLCVCTGLSVWLHCKRNVALSSTLNFVDMQCMVVAKHVLTLRSKGQRSRSHSYQMCCHCQHEYACQRDFLGFQVLLELCFYDAGNIHHCYRLVSFCMGHINARCPDFTKFSFLYMLTVAVAICYVLPVTWMTAT